METAVIIIVVLILFILIVNWMNGGENSKTEKEILSGNSSKPLKQTESVPRQSEADKVQCETEQKQKLEDERKRLVQKTSEDEQRWKDVQEQKKKEGRKRDLARQQRYRQDWKQFQDVLGVYEIKALYHFTDKENIQSIKRHGALYSWHYCQANSIQIIRPGGDQLSRSLDERYKVQNYVRVSFTKSHPMMYIAKSQGRICDPVILEIDPEVVFWKDSKYANKNATRNDVNIGATLEDFQSIRFDIVQLPNHFNLSDIEKPFYQAEILILEKIPLEFIKNINNL